MVGLNKPTSSIKRAQAKALFRGRVRRPRKSGKQGSNNAAKELYDVVPHETEVGVRYEIKPVRAPRINAPTIHVYGENNLEILNTINKIQVVHDNVHFTIGPIYETSNEAVRVPSIQASSFLSIDVRSAVKEVLEAVAARETGRIIASTYPVPPTSGLVPTKVGKASKEVAGGSAERDAILAHATEVFGSVQAAQDWFLKPSTWFENQSPVDVLQAGRKADLERYLTQVEYGVYV